MNGFTRQLRGELRKLAGPGSLVVLAVFVAILWQDASTTIQYAYGQTPVAVAVPLDIQRQLDEQCPAASAAQDDECALLLLDSESNRHFASNGRELGEVAASLDTLPGLLTFVSHQLSTGFGWTVLGLLAALHVTRETATGTARESILRVGRSRYMLGKGISLTVAAGALIVIATACLFLARPTFTREISAPVRSAGPGGALSQPQVALAGDEVWSSWAQSGLTFLRSMILIAAVCALFTAIASLARRPAFAALLMIGIVVGLFVVAQGAGSRGWVPLSELSRLLRLNDVPYGVRDVRLWDISGRSPDIYSLRPRTDPAITAVVAWTLVTVTASVGALWIFRVKTQAD